MKNLIRILISFALGVGIGGLIETFLTVKLGSLVVGVPDFVNQHSLVYVKVIQTILYGGFGVVSFLIGKLYDTEKLSLFFKTIINLIIIFTYFVLVGSYLKWFTEIKGLVLSIILFLVIYFIIWTVIHIMQKKEITNMNKKLKSLQKKN